MSNPTIYVEIQNVIKKGIRKGVKTTFLKGGVSYPGPCSGWWPTEDITVVDKIYSGAHFIKTVIASATAPVILEEDNILVVSKFCSKLQNYKSTEVIIPRGSEVYSIFQKGQFWVINLPK